MGKFKVGDRVRMVKEVDGYKSDKTATVIHDDGTDSIPLAIEFAEPFKEGHSAGGTGKYGYCWWVSADDIELAPLTIEAGKFYMTRDGRRVGPLAKGAYDLYGAPQVDFSSTAHWYGNGRCLSDSKEHHADLIAEAPAPAYTANAAAEVDNQADDYGGCKKAPKFKVGDRVRNKSVPEAGVGVVEAIKPEGGYRVNYKDTWYGVCHDTDNDMVIVTPAHSHAIVAVIEDGKPKPATRPYVHTDRAAAKAEAERLAGINKGKTFGVYELVDEAKVERVYEHEWQRLAAGGEKINAIRELRSIAGLGLATAKRAVEDWLEREAA